MEKIEKTKWIIAFLASVIFPKLTAPFAAPAFFDMGGTISGMLGFSGMVWFLNKRNISGIKKLGVAAGAAVIGIVTFILYDKLLHNPDYATPSDRIQIIEFVLYCVCYLCLFVFFTYVLEHAPSAFRIFRGK